MYLPFSPGGPMGPGGPCGPANPSFPGGPKVKYQTSFHSMIVVFCPLN